jgi:cell filamentation protein
LSDPYLVPGTGVLRNKYGILNADDLDRLIDDIATIEAAYLFNEGPPVRPTLAGWQAVHRAMFGDSFDWAGDFRTIHIRKLDENGHPSGYFAAPDRIEADCRKAIRHLEATLRRAATDDIARIAGNLA